ncbi:hypothetical protein PO909_013918 [Leuciscus waleckii]
MPNVCSEQERVITAEKQPCVQAFTRMVKVWRQGCAGHAWCMDYERSASQLLAAFENGQRARERQQLETDPFVERRWLLRVSDASGIKRKLKTLRAINSLGNYGRTAYYMGYRQIYRQDFKTTYKCCPGWSQLNAEEGCIYPLCAYGVCFNGGVCTGHVHQLCDCLPGFNGSSCQYGEHKLSEL